MPTLFSYVVHHDYGLSPNPSGGYCTLAFCKFRRADGMPNVVELAQEGDWVAGTGGKSQLSAGHGYLIYAMQVTKKLTLREYFRDERFRVRAGNVEEWRDEGDMFALISDHFYYYGRNAPRLRHSIEKRGPGFRNHFDDALVEKFVAWLPSQGAPGVNGPPCASHRDADWVTLEWRDIDESVRSECRSVGRQTQRPRRGTSSRRCRRGS
jgi:hypothetical protein